MNTFKVRDKNTGEVFTVREKSVAAEEAPEKLSFSEGIADKFTGGMISEGKKIQREASEGKFGEKAAAFAEGSQGFQDTMRTAGQIGQSFLLGNLTAKAVGTIPALAKQPIIQGLVASAETKAANAGIRFSNIQRAIQRHAIEGAVSVQPFDYASVTDRIKATAIAGTIAPVLAGSVQAGMKVATNIVRDIRKVESAVKGGLKTTASGKIRDPRLPSITKVAEELSEAQKKGAEIGESSRRQIVSAQKQGAETAGLIKERASALEESVSSAAKSEQFALKQSLKETERQITSSIKNLDPQLAKESDVAAKTFQSKITGFFRENSSAYGKKLDSISEAIAGTGRMTRGEALDVLERTLQRSASEAEVVDGPIVERLKGLIKSKYAVDFTDEAGNLMQRDPGEMVPFKDFLAEVRSVWKTIKPYKSGARFTQDEIPAAILQSEFGELVSSLPGGEAFQSLQQSYRPVISYMNRANSVLKPYKGEAYTKQAEALVKRYAKGTVDESDKQLIEFMEVGTEKFAKGMGSVTARARQIGENIKTLKKSMTGYGLQAEKRIFEIAENAAMKLSRIDETASEAGKLIQSEIDRKSALIMQEAALEEMKIWKRVSQLGGRKDEIRSLLEKRKLLNKLAVAATRVIGGIASAYVITKGGQELLQILREPK